jgi:hypothetical protein
VKSDSPALAVIDGALCRLTRQGTKAGGCAPLASGVAEFRQAPLRCYVREHPYGLLPGLPNLYCLDGAFRLQWLAEWPDPADPCAAIVDEEDGALITRSVRGMMVRLDVHTGRLLRADPPMAVAS